MDNDQPASLNNTQRELLTDILDQLIPAREDGSIPSAGTIGIANTLEQLARHDPEFRTLLTKGLQQAQVHLPENTRGIGDLNNQQRLSYVRELETSLPEFFESLLRNTYMSYYSRADIRAALGLSELPTQPKGYAVPIEPPNELAQLTADVVARGPCFRQC